MDYFYFIGISESEDGGILDLFVNMHDKFVGEYECINDIDRIIDKIEEIKSDYLIDNNDFFICSEYTGHNPSPLILACNKMEYPLSMINLVEIRSILCQMDIDGSIHHLLAMYASLFHNRLHISKSPDADIMYLDNLEQARRTCSNDLCKYEEILGKREDYTTGQAYNERLETYKPIINVLTNVLADIVDKMDNIIMSSKKLSRQMELLLSIDEVDHELARRMIAYTMGFTRFEDPEEFFCYVDTNPYNDLEDTKDPSITEGREVGNLLFQRALTSRNRKCGELHQHYLLELSQAVVSESTIDDMCITLITWMFEAIKANKPHPLPF